MTNFTAKIKGTINPSIQVGDIVKLIDGSALTHESGDCWIVNSYPELTSSDKVLKEIPCTVLEVGIADQVCVDDYFVKQTNIVYIQDIVVQCGNATFRTNSGMVYKL